MTLRYNPFGKEGFDYTPPDVSENLRLETEEENNETFNWRKILLISSAALVVFIVIVNFFIIMNLSSNAEKAVTEFNSSSQTIHDVVFSRETSEKLAQYEDEERVPEGIEQTRSVIETMVEDDADPVKIHRGQDDLDAALQVLQPFFVCDTLASFGDYGIPIEPETTMCRDYAHKAQEMMNRVHHFDRINNSPLGFLAFKSFDNYPDVTKAPEDQVSKQNPMN